jgi:hypothetical protein
MGFFVARTNNQNLVYQKEVVRAKTMKPSWLAGFHEITNLLIDKICTLRKIQLPEA